jgi:predicted GTPase
LIDSLAQAGADASGAADTIRLDDAGPIDADERDLAAVVAKAAESDGVLFVVDQDLRAPEVAAIKRLMETGKPLYLVLNKADQFNASDRDTILVSIRAKMPAGFSPAHAVSVSVAPSAVEREIQDARGAVRIELRKPSPDLRALTNLLARVFPPRSGRQLHFAADTSPGA